MDTRELLAQTHTFLGRIDRLKKDDTLPLRQVIRGHNALYYEKESPIISDYEYDRLFHALARLEVEYGMLDDDSPTAKLAIMTSEQFQKVKHLYPMTSLDNTYNPQEVYEWNERMYRILLADKRESHNAIDPLRFSYFVQPKYDGLWMAIIYVFGELVQAVTRGSGTEGEDVTLWAREIRNIPKYIAALKEIPRMEIRGEVMMSRAVFARVNTERMNAGERLFANPRNAASGSLRQLDPLITRSRQLEFFAYSIPSFEKDDGAASYGITQYHSMMNLLEEWGFPRQDFSFKMVNGIENLQSVLHQETEKYWQNSQSMESITNHTWEIAREIWGYFDFDIDGMVIKLDDMTLWKPLWHTEHHPRYAIAYKFPAKQVRTKVLSIEHSVGRTGAVTPVANLLPVEVTGVVVRRATLHNYDELVKKDVRVGDTVFVMRAGEVIPEIVSVVSSVRDGTESIEPIPTHCPVCQTPLTQESGKVAIVCPNHRCPAKIQGQFEMFVSKQGMNIDGLGEKQIERFIAEGWLTDFASIFSLRTFQEEILRLDGYKEKSVNNLLNAIDDARHTTLDRVLGAIGIPNVGKKTAKQIAWLVIRRAMEYHTTIFEALYSLSEESLVAERDIGIQTAQSFVQYRTMMRSELESLFSVLDIALPMASGDNTSQGAGKVSVLAGLSFCVTGSFPHISRDALHELIEQYGGEVRTSVSARLDFLIAGEKSGTKSQKASTLGVRIIDLEEFYGLLDK